MTIPTKHNPAHCDVCAAQQEADTVGAIPTAGHKERDTLEQLIGQLAFAIHYGGDSDLVSQVETRRLLMEFAEEIKRQAVEP